MPAMRRRGTPSPPARLLTAAAAAAALLAVLPAAAQPPPSSAPATAGTTAAPPRATAGCPSDEAVDALAQNLLANRPSPPFTGMTSLEDGLCAQGKLVRILQSHWGRPVGYKLALTSAPVQQRFGVNHPLRGVIFENTVRLRSGAEVSARFGVQPIVESDFLVRVRDDGINTAGRDHVAILRHLDVVIPFIELPDVPLSGNPDAANLLAINAGARLGVLGTPIPVEATEDFARRLGAMVVTMTDDTGKQLARLPGTAVLGHPLNAVAFLVEDLAKQGRRLEAGQLLSIAGFSPLITPEAGRTYTVRYEGLLAEPVSVTVRMTSAAP
jgi:2-keto-4-pentenoate hydratase